MTNKLYKNQNGFTLVELLAAISLFAILIALSSATIMQLLNSEDKTSDLVSLRQDTNVLISELRGQYHNGESELCFNEEEKEFNYEILIDGNPVEINNGCIEDIDKEEPLEIQITTTTRSRQKLTINTTWKNKKDLAFNVIKKASEQLEYDPNKDSQTYEGDTLFIDHKVEKNNDVPIIVTGNATFQGETDMAQGVELIISGDATSDNALNMGQGSSMNIGGGATFLGDVNLDMKQSAEIIIDKNATFEGDINMKNSSVIEIKGNATFNGEIVLKDKSSIKIIGDATFTDNIKISGGGTICVTGETNIDKGQYTNMFRCPT